MYAIFSDAIGETPILHAPDAVKYIYGAVIVGDRQYTPTY